MKRLFQVARVLARERLYLRGRSRCNRNNSAARHNVPPMSLSSLAQRLRAPRARLVVDTAVAVLARRL